MKNKNKPKDESQRALEVLRKVIKGWPGVKNADEGKP